MITNLKNSLRTMLKIRADRELPPAGSKPQVGSNIVLDRLRIRLKYPITDEQWKWFTEQGWRTVDMRTDRRRYTCVPDRGVLKLLAVDGLEREVMHKKLLGLVSEEARAQRRAVRAEKAEDEARNVEAPLVRNSGIGA